MRRLVLIWAAAALLVVPATASAAIDTRIVFEGDGSGEVFGEPGAEGGDPHIECHWDGEAQKIDKGTPVAGKCETEAQNLPPPGIAVRQKADEGSEFLGWEVPKGAPGQGCKGTSEFCSVLFPPIEIKAKFKSIEPPPPPGIKQASVSFRDGEGTAAGPAGRAGSHPFAMKVGFDVNTFVEEGLEFPVGSVRDLTVELPVGLAGDPTAVPSCPAARFLERTDVGGPKCPDSSALGRSAVKFDFDPFPAGQDLYAHVSVYNLEPPPGVAQRIGMVVIGVPVTIDSTLSTEPPYRVISRATNISQAALFISQRLTIWGDPGDPDHNPLRGGCLEPSIRPAEEPGSVGDDCLPAPGERRPFLTLPRSCSGPLATGFEALWWAGLMPDGEGGSVFDPGARDSATAPSEEMVDCPALVPGFAPEISAQPTSDHASSPTGLDFSLQINNPGLTNPAGRSVSDIKEARVTLPEGVTINPSQAEGLKTCSEGDLGRETLSSRFGSGCPAASKIGTIEVETPLLKDEVLRGELFVATPHANQADNALIAFYILIRDRKLGILVKQAAKVEPDPRTGQLVTTTENMPQLPFSDFRLRFKEGGRSPLVTPNGCGTYEVKARFTPWADPSTSRERTSSFRISRGVGGGPCPPGGPPPFEPGFAASTLSNQAGTHSPFLMSLTRRDGDQDLTRFDAILPRGVVAKLAGIPWCPEWAIAQAKDKSGKAELAAPSCPAASQIGTVQGGAGVGSQLTYVPGKIYLAGPVGGAPLSVVGIVPAVAGPFDVGTVVVRQALDLDPVTGEAKVDGALSDPLPHILAGIPLRVREIQVDVDRPDFTLNPTSCQEMATLAGIWGGGEHVFSTADDAPVLRQARFQAAGCRGLGFKPRLAIKLKGGVKRGAHPALRAHVRPRPGDANFSRAVVKLPTSAFLDQAHIRTICTRVQFAAGPGHGALCPQGARYGFARAWSPLLEGPVTGPVYLRSSDNNLPDLVAALSGPPSAAVRVELSARIDSVKGGIRSTFAAIPDVPVSRFILDMQGGKKGLIVNSRHLCHKPKRNRARANLRGQNGRLSRTRPVVRAVRCAKQRRPGRGSRPQR